MSADEITLAMSYYVFYCNLEEAAAQATTKDTAVLNDAECEKESGSAEVSNTHNDDDDDSDGAGSVVSPWVEDEWTAEDEEKAAKLLEENSSRCRITAAAAASSSLSSNNCDRKNDDHNNNSESGNAAAWNRFYGHHRTNFFKDRNHLSVSFPSEFGAVSALSSSDQDDDNSNTNSNSNRCLVEVGCGVGNAMLPLLENSNKTNVQWTVYGLDLSSVAIDLLQQDPRFIKHSAAAAAAAAPDDVSMDRQQQQQERRAFGATCDISINGSIPRHFLGVATVTSLLFCLSAIDPAKHGIAVQNAVATMQPGAVLVFRDYGRYDEAQMRLGTQRGKLLPATTATTDGTTDHSFYRKHDGTKCHYFTVEYVRRLFVTSGLLEPLECRYIRRVYKNRSAGGTERRRVWVQARFRSKTTRMPMQLMPCPHGAQY